MIVKFPSAWTTLTWAIEERRPVRANYHGRGRILCPHALGWKNGRAQVLSFQVGSEWHLPPDPQQCWRLMFVDEIEDAVLTDGRWLTAENYLPGSHGFDVVEVEIGRATLK
jgi:hypothetical protein